MHTLNIICCCLVPILCILIFEGYASDTQNYGPYEIKILSYELEFKHNLQSFLDMDCRVKQNDDGSYACYVYANVKKNMGVLGMRFRTYIFNEQVQKFVLSFQITMKNVCSKQKLLKPIVALIPGLDGDCKIKPNIYNFTIQSVNRLMEKVLGEKFFYGKYMVINDIMAAGHGRFLRTNVTANLQPI